MDSATSESLSDEILVEACIKGDTLKLQDMLQAAHPKPSPQPSASQSPSLTATMLIEAIKHDHPSTIRLILDKLPPRTEISEESIQRALLSPSVDMNKILFTYDPDIIHKPIFDGRETQLGKALSVPTTPEKLQVLLNCGLKPATDPFSMNELILACGQWQTQSITLCTQLLDHGALLQHSGALAAAAKTGRIEVVRWLLEQGADVNDVVTNAALVESRHRGHPWPALHTAVREGHLDVVRLLFKRGADPQVLDRDGRTAFEVAEEGASKEEMLVFLKG